MSSRILHLTDTHLHADPAFEHMGVNTKQSLLEVLAHVEASNQKPDLILITGDLTHDETAAGYQQLRTIMDSLRVPVYILPGNHDLPSLINNNMLSTSISNQAHITLEHWHIIMLDTSIRGSECGELATSQLTLLQQTLDDNPERHTLICMHHQPIPVGSRWLDTMQVKNSDAFMQIIQPHTQIKAVLWGHVHQAFHSQYAAIDWIATPATCRQFLPGSEDFAMDNTKGAGYRWLQLQDNGTIETQLVWV